MNRWSYALLVLPLSVGVWLGCSSRASDASDFYEKRVENACYIIKKCMKWSWNDAEWKNIDDERAAIRKKMTKKYMVEF